jgi:hypothetical protein
VTGRPHRQGRAAVTASTACDDDAVLDLRLPDGPGDPLVRGFAACLSSVTEVAVDELPALTGDEPLPHALGAWRSWLAGRGSGLVPIAEPRSFQ